MLFTIPDSIIGLALLSMAIGSKVYLPQMNTDEHRCTQIFSNLSVFICVYLWLNQSVMCIFKIAKPEIEKKGLYVVKGLCIIDVRVLVISEIEDDLEKEIKYLKIFAGKKERKDFIKWVLENESEDYILTQVILLYGDEVMKVAKEKGIKLRGLEKRAEEMAEVFGLKSKFFDEGSKFGYEQGAKTGYEQGTKIGLSKGQSRGQRKIELKTAINMIQFGMEKETILKVISISEKKLDWLIKRLNK
ncbi:MAG: hypothetical protein KDK90_13275 [Leptospiraceae bacterium]|nr:hypothetical protein [Leptospiraceae bacterium]